MELEILCLASLVLVISLENGAAVSLVLNVVVRPHAYPTHQMRARSFCPLYSPMLTGFLSGFVDGGLGGGGGALQSDIDGASPVMGS